MAANPANAGLNRYLADQLGLSTSVFDGAGGFWRAARERGYSDGHINSLIGGYDAQFNRDGTAKSQASYGNLSVGTDQTRATAAPTTATSNTDAFEQAMADLQAMFEKRLKDQSDLLSMLQQQQQRGGRTNTQIREDPLALNRFLAARYTNAGRSRSSMDVGGVGGSSGGPQSGLIF